MAFDAVLAIAYTPSAPTFPEGTVVGSIQVTVTGSAVGNTTPVVGSVAAGTPSVTVDLTVADAYTYSVQALDASGNALGTAITGAFETVAPVLVSVSLPSSVSVTVVNT